MNPVERLKRDSLNYVKESRKYIYYAAIAFLIFVAVGFIFADKLGFLDKILAELVEDVSKLSGFDIALYIFANNVRSALIGMIGGVLAGILPMVNIVTNGIVVGYVLAKTAGAYGFLEFWRLLPHGIFELPAIFIALGLGIKLGASLFMKNPWKTLKERAYKSAAVFITIIIPLLAVAALIEGMLIALSS